MILKAFVILLALTLPVAAAPYHSNPFATNVLYVNRTAVPWTAPDEVVDPILALVAQIFTGFNLDITDEFPGFRYNVVQVVVGGPITNGAAGMSGIGPWKQGTYYDQFSDQHIFAAYVYADGLGNELIQTADAISHEGGHNIGLQHQSQGIMWKYINNDPRQLFWTKGINEVGDYQDDRLIITQQVGVSALPEVADQVPEPSLLLILLPVLLQRQGRI